MEKEQRRRKIMARGTDRMALITGRINTLDPDPISKCSSFSVHRTDLPPPLHARSSSEPLSANDQAFFQFGVCDTPNITSTKQDNAEEDSRRNETRNRAPEAHKHDQKELAAALTSNNNTHSSSQKHCVNLLGPLTAQAINYGLASSEDIRATCSTLLGVVVVITQIIIHFLKPETSLVAFRPLFAVVLTDILIVAVKLLPYARTRKEEEAKCDDDDANNFDGAMKMLELGLVLYHVTGAIFVDCSFYIVVVIIGLCIM